MDKNNQFEINMARASGGAIVDFTANNSIPYNKLKLANNFGFMNSSIMNDKPTSAEINIYNLTLDSNLLPT